MASDPRPEREPAAPPPLTAPEVVPPARDPVRERTAGDDPAPSRPDPRLLVEFF